MTRIFILLIILVVSFQSSHAAQQTSAPLTPSLTESYQTDLMTGAAVVNVPVTVPPGRKGIQPNLALSYSSSNSNGICGVGWQLDMGSIQRNTKRGVPKYDSSDSFVASINGASIELVDIGSGEYRAKQEGAFMKLSFDGASWQVKDKSGTTYSFGSSDNSRQYNSGRIYRWYLDSVTDVNGNYMTVSYLQDQNQVYPQQIQYTGKVSADAPSNTVEFIYEARNDVISDMRPTFEVRTEKRLSEINIKAGGDRVRKYILNYSYSADTVRSLLTSITQFGSDGTTSLPPIIYEYQKGGGFQ